MNLKRISQILLFSLIPVIIFSQFPFKAGNNICEFCYGGNLNSIDLDNDDDFDLIYLSTNRQKILWQENDGKGKFTEQESILDNTGGINLIRVADFDNDGDFDILYYSKDSKKIAYLINNRTDFFTEEQIVSINAPDFSSIFIDDLNGDSISDIIVSSFTDNWISWYQNNEEGLFSDNQIISTQLDKLTFISIVDVNNDTYNDIIFKSASDISIGYLKNDGKNNFPEIVSISDSSEFGIVSSFKKADLDNDSDYDLFIANLDEGIKWYENDGGGNFMPPKNISRPIDRIQQRALFAYSADLDNDNDNDVFSVFNIRISGQDTSGTFGDVSWYENDGRGNFSAQKNIANIPSTFAMSIDIDGDMDLDIIAIVEGGKMNWYENLLDSPTLSGRIFWDRNENKILDGSENKLTNIPIQLNPEYLSFYTNFEGYYNFAVDNGTYTISPSPDSCWQLTTDSSKYTIVVSENNIERNINFGYKLVSSYQNAQIKINSTPTRCGFNVKFWLSVENNGCQPVKGQYGIVLSPLVNLIYTEIEPIEERGDTIFWNYEELISSETQNLQLTFEIAGADFVGEYINLTGLSYVEDEFGNLNLSSTYDYSSEIRCAYDPNDKLVSPNRLQQYSKNYTLFDEMLEYTIRFQNTGNDTALTVVLRDTLDKNLDWTTFRPVIASHSYETILNTEEGAIEFSFRDILLPDSTTNEPLSHGFVTYKISPKKDLPENTIIENTASIYFDFNSPIVTNTTQNVMVSELPQTTPTNNLIIQQVVKIYPNPFGDFLTIENDLLSNEVSTLSIFDVTGRELKRATLQNDTQQVSTASFSNGLYFYQVTNADGQMIANGKLVKH